jgi:GTP-binding protein
MTQAKARPPTFAIFCSKPAELAGSYLRYLENALRDDFGLPGTPIRLQLRKGKNPYAGKRDPAKPKAGGVRR